MNKTNLRIKKLLGKGLDNGQIARKLGRPLTHELHQRIVQVSNESL